MLAPTLLSLSSFDVMGEFSFFHYLFSICLNNSTLDAVMALRPIVCCRLREQNYCFVLHALHASHFTHPIQASVAHKRMTQLID